MQKKKINKYFRYNQTLQSNPGSSRKNKNVSVFLSNKTWEA